MAVKIRLARRGRKKRAMYDVVVADARAPRDGRFIEKIGTYNPNVDPASVDINAEKAFDWVMKGAQPTDTVKAMLSYRGVMYRKHLQIGVNKGAITQEEADKRLQEWLDQKEAKIQGKVDSLAQKKEADRKSRLEAESKVKEARAEAIKQRQAAELAASQPEEEATEEAPAEEASTEAEVVAEAPAVEEAPAEEVAEAPAEEAPKAEEAPGADASTEEEEKKD